jgi:hypothetical protein
VSENVPGGDHLQGFDANGQGADVK